MPPSMLRPARNLLPAFLRLFLVLFSIPLLLAACGSRSDENSSGAITIITDPGIKGFESLSQLAQEFEAQTGHHVRLLKAPSDATERLSQYLQYLGAESPDIDIYQVDVIWPATLQHHLADLSDTFTTETQAFLPQLIKNNTVDGRLVAIPWFVDIPMLYYRADLLEKHGLASPPAIWDELTTMAAALQKAERKAGNSTIWGYVWQGRAYEGLTCNALEWQASEDGGRIVSTDGRIEVSTPGAIRAFTRAASWVGTISPPGVTTYSEEEARQTFQAGNAVFMRNWPYAYSLISSEGSPVAGKVKVAAMPRGTGQPAATLGGWQLAVSKYSPRREAATELVRYITSAHGQKDRALAASVLPTRMALYDDGDIAKKFPFVPTMRNALETAVARPSNATGADYNEVSTYYFQHVHRILTGQMSAEESMAALDTLLNKVLKP